ncbi:hypothetical protein KW843_15175 [Acidovorax sp. sif1233]|uniref:hypothetical protein n=1 Tax=Acidovorax sp. sif1233 TaxID=2854792 RepID=UPI001C490123|nr:hypothetical protein [Acidovorax sp. sif1233]MBV7455820.1 hypothetical protein [Acidovorax sp. sif1233]
MSFLSIDAAAEFLVRVWHKLYAQSPRITVAITLFVSVTAGAIVFFVEHRAAEQREAKRLQNLNYSVQAQKLEETKSNLKALLEFVEDERSSLAASERALRSLKDEHEQLKPLVESDRKTIDALFSAQEARNQAAQSTERWIGFALGVGSSLVASFILAIVSYARRKNPAAA